MTFRPCPGKGLASSTCARCNYNAHWNVRKKGVESRSTARNNVPHVTRVRHGSLRDGSLHEGCFVSGMW